MTTKRKKLKTIASIRSGYPFRSKVEHNSKGIIRVIQMKDLNQYHEIDWRDVTKTHIKDFSEGHLLKPGDILLQSRGINNSCALVTEEIEQAVADSSLTVISLKSNKINPDYLVWYLNHPHTQHQISRLAEGTSLLRVSNSALGELKIKCPSLQKQDLIAKIDCLSRREQQLIGEITQKRQAYIGKSLEIAASN